MTNELIVIEQETALQVFSADAGLDPIIQQAKDAVAEFEHDLSTAAGRKRTASLANKVAKLKVHLDGMGKELVSDWKSKAKVVDSNRKAMRDDLDELKATARKPLTEWEAEQAAIEAEKAHIAMLEDAHKINAEFDEYQAQQKIIHHMEAIIDNHAFDEQRKVDAENARREAEQAEKDRIANEQRIAEEATKRAEANALAEKQRLEQEKINAENARKVAEQKAIDAENQRVIDAANAEKKRLADIEQTKIDEAKKVEDKRIADEAEAAKRKANIAHQTMVKKAIIASLMQHAGLDQASATTTAKSLWDGKIDYASIAY